MEKYRNGRSRDATAQRRPLRALIGALLLAASPAFADCTRHAYTAIAADVISSEIAVHNGAHEANPLLGGGGTTALAISALVRAGVVWLADRADTRANCTIAAFTYGVAANNLAVAAGADRETAIAVGIGVSIPLWPGKESE
jgi:hypothetical protein